MKAALPLGVRSVGLLMSIAALLGSVMSAGAAPVGEDPTAPFGEDPGCLQLWNDAYYDPAQGPERAYQILNDCRARIAAGQPAIVPKSGGGIITADDLEAVNATTQIYSETLSPEGVAVMGTCMMAQVAAGVPLVAAESACAQQAYGQGLSKADVAAKAALLAQLEKDKEEAAAKLKAEELAKAAREKEEEEEEEEKKKKKNDDDDDKKKKNNNKHGTDNHQGNTHGTDNKSGST